MTHEDQEGNYSSEYKLTLIKVKIECFGVDIGLYSEYIMIESGYFRTKAWQEHKDFRGVINSLDPWSPAVTLGELFMLLLH